MMEIAWLIPVFPLASFVLLLLFGKKLGKGSSAIGVVFSGIAFVSAVAVLLQRISGSTYTQEWNWLTIGDKTLTVGFQINALNALMLVIVTLVSFLVHIYSRGYMAEDKRLSVFYAYLGLFTFSMLGLVISTNLLQTYFFWELVGVGSFLLIGFYYYKEEARAAAKKAFIMTRIGDVGLFIGMILLFWQTGSFRYEDIFNSVVAGEIAPNMVTLTAILIFIGAIGKSGQFPLHTWLPDAMEGPTPVSALIHAATMVAAGVYLVATMFPLFQASATAMLVVATIGGFTAIFAALIGLTQSDIKRILAYSTVSQLGYMMLALGSGGYVAGIFHLTTHAFFKALLFLGAGSVIHAVHTQSIEEMGGLYGKMKTTAVLFLIGTLSISGFPLLSGFFSKDEILMTVWMSGNKGLFALAIIAAFCTAFYMFRLFFLVFTGESKTKGHVHESPKTMTIPMIVLGALAVFAGYINTPWFGTFLQDFLAQDRSGIEVHEGPVWIMILATTISLAGILLAYLMYNKKSIPRDWFTSIVPSAYKVVQNKFYVDELYHYTFVALTKGISWLAYYIERYVVEGIARTIVAGVRGVSSVGSNTQNGQIQRAGVVAFIGLTILLAAVILTGGYF